MAVDMILPTNPRSATFAVAQFIFKNGPSTQQVVVAALTGKFSERTIATALNEMTRVGMAFESIGVGDAPNLLNLKPHVIKFFFDIEPDADQDKPEVVAAPYRKDWRVGSLSPQFRPRPPMRDGADDYKRIPSLHIPAKGRDL